MSSSNFSLRVAKNFGFIALAFFAPSVASAGPNLVENGGFETGDFSGWITTPPNDYFGVDNRTPLSGNFSAYFGSVTGIADEISQVVPTSSGTVYSVTFRVDSPFSSKGKASFVGEFAGVSFLSISNADTDFSDTVFSFTVTASSSSSLLSFSATNSAYYYLLDDINVAAAVPEPATALLMMLGLGVLGPVSRRSSASSDGYRTHVD